MTRTDWNSFRFYGWYSEHCIALVLGYGYVHFSMYIVFNFQRIDDTSPPQNDIKPMLRSPLKAWEKNQSKIEANRKKATNSRSLLLPLLLLRVCLNHVIPLVMVAYKTQAHTIPSHPIPSIYLSMYVWCHQLLCDLFALESCFHFLLSTKFISMQLAVLWDCVCLRIGMPNHVGAQENDEKLSSVCTGKVRKRKRKERFQLK